MQIPPSNSFARFSTMCGLALLVASGLAFAGDKIRFSDEPEKTASPNKRSNADLSRPFDLKEGSPDGTEPAPLPPPPPASKIRDPKLEEYIDQKKNWMFSTPSKTDSDSALKEMFNKFDKMGGDKKRKSAIDRYFEQETESRKKLFEKLNARDKDSEASGKQDESVDNGSIVGLPLEQGTRSSIAPGSEPDPNSWGRKASEFGSPISMSPGDVSPRNFNSADVLGLPRRGPGSASQFFGSEQRGQRLDEFQKTLGVVNSARPGLLRDPINLQNDGTRQPLNPIAGTSSPGIGTGLDTGFTSVGGLAGPSPRSAMSDLINSRPLGGSSLSPAVIMPSAPGFSQQRPAMLEIPRRKF